MYAGASECFDLAVAVIVTLLVHIVRVSAPV